MIAENCRHKKVTGNFFPLTIKMRVNLMIELYILKHLSGICFNARLLDPPWRTISSFKIILWTLGADYPRSSRWIFDRKKDLLRGFENEQLPIRFKSWYSRCLFFCLLKKICLIKIKFHKDKVFHKTLEHTKWFNIKCFIK